MTEEQKLYVVRELCEYYSAQEIVDRIPELDLKVSGVYAFIRRHKLNTFKTSQKDRKVYYENLYKEHEEELKEESLGNVYQFLKGLK